eukprot:8425863-Lingulodinium_polyedra.AAC.1
MGMQSRFRGAEATAKALASGSGTSSASTATGPADVWASYRPFAAPAPPASAGLEGYVKDWADPDASALLSTEAV